MATVSVRIPGQSAYDVIIRPGLLGEAGSELRKLSRAGGVAVVTDSVVGPLYWNALEASLRKSGFESVSTIIPAGEQHKNLRTLLPVYDKLLATKCDRNTPLIALGGGVVGDMAGFVAATMLRGVPFVQVPTSLLAMVDASVGGKTGVDHALGKNLIGAFYQPMAVLIDPETLRSLPPRELRCGLAECIKHQIIRDADGFARLEKSIGRALALDMEYLTELIAQNVAIKGKVVEADPLEKGERAHLNFGHTFGHAIEAAANYSRPHGECVALGMIAASRLANRLGMLDEGSVRRIIALIAAADLPTGKLAGDAASILDAMAFDKKAKSGRLRFVLPDRIGHVVIRDDVPGEAVRNAMESLNG
jgi:3-dehydroquinate synthase